MNYGEPLESPLIINLGKYDTRPWSFSTPAPDLSPSAIAEMDAIIKHNENVPIRFCIDDPLVVDVVFYPFGHPPLTELTDDFNFNICTWRVDGEWWSGGSSIETECRLLRKGYLDVLSTGRKAYGVFDRHGRLRNVATIEAPFKLSSFKGYPKLLDVQNHVGHTLIVRYTNDSVSTPYLETMGHKYFKVHNNTALTIKSLDPDPEPFYNVPLYVAYPQSGYDDYYFHRSFIGYSEKTGKIKVNLFYVGFEVLKLDYDAVWYRPHYLCFMTQEKGFFDSNKCCLAECFGITE